MAALEVPFRTVAVAARRVLAAPAEMVLSALVERRTTARLPVGRKFPAGATVIVERSLMLRMGVAPAPDRRLQAQILPAKPEATMGVVAAAEARHRPTKQAARAARDSLS
jgi:hypothetical protein